MLGSFNFIEKYGEDLTARQYITNPAIGRDEEIRELSLVLLTPDKSAILTGKPGIGKTAIVEGLAYRIQKGEVPDALKGYTIVKIDTQTLMGVIPKTGDTRIHTLVNEIKEKEKFILFVDEIHTLINSTDDSSLDFANMFKTGLGRGDVKIVGATTTEEYERYILKDKAFVRRFQKIEILEPTEEETTKILIGTLPKIEKLTKAKMAYTPFIQEQLLSFLTNITKEYNRVYEVMSRYPDVSLTLLQQCFSEALFDNKRIVTVEHIERAILNSKLIYPDVINKEIEKFREQFKDLIEQEKELKRDFEYDIF